MKRLFAMLALATAIAAAGTTTAPREIVATDAYRWVGDSVIQGQFKAYAVSDTEIVSDYEPQPHFFMPVEKRWTLKNDISRYPRLKSSNRLHNAIYNMGLDEMIIAVEPDTTLRTGKEWAGVWTRDVSYSIILSMAYLQPEASKISLMKKVNSNGRIVQDTGSGGAWPVSSDRMVWALAAYELYKVTGDRGWLEYIYPVIRDSFADDAMTTAGSETGLVRGETSFIDWREQSYPKWMQTADIYQSEAMNTSIVHAAALDILSKIAAELGNTAESKQFAERGKAISDAVNERLWMPDKGYYGMYLYGRDNLILNPRAETLGESLSVLYDIAPAQRQREITENNPVTPYGPAIFYPQIKDMPAYHNNALWPFVASFWTLANAKAGNEQGTLQGIGSVFRPAALFATNKENFNLDNGDIATELNSSNMLWSLSGNLAITCRILFGIHFEEDGLLFAPFVPETLADTRELTGFPYRGASLDIKVRGYGDKIKSLTLNGKPHAPFIKADELKKGGKIDIVMADNTIEPLKVNNVKNKKAPLTPIAWIENGRLRWNPIEYIDHYVVVRDGKRIAETDRTDWEIDSDGEYQVIGVDSDGTESFASEPRNTSPVVTAEMPDEKTEMNSAEVSYEPRRQLAGFNGGFAELDHKTGPVTVPIEVKAPGRYSISFIYANGNGPVNTENKCAIRTVSVDGKRAGVIVMPTRGVGNWNDWGETNRLHVDLPAGRHTVTVSYEPENENMNLSTNHALIDRMEVVRLSD